MSLAQPFAEIEYPESDGKPMAETELHLEWMIDIRNRLKYRYQGQRVYVGANLLVYYVEGDARKSVAPDGFVVKDCDPGRRRTFKTWVEQRTPDVVFEVTSSSTRSEDEKLKPQTYARIGVKELFLYDPTGDYLDPVLQGYCFSRGRKTRIRPNASGALECRELGLLVRLDDAVALHLFDSGTGERLLTEAEAADARAQKERAAREAVEEELRRLRDQLQRDAGS
ncbi:MAG: Uma2 family endonuclease [Planctomycetaceae bacterium]